jgi:hypothetical protein
MKLLSRKKICVTQSPYEGVLHFVQDDNGWRLARGVWIALIFEKGWTICSDRFNPSSFRRVNSGAAPVYFSIRCST